MNQEQRKFLITKIESTYKDQVEAIESSIPEEPTMNKYVIASILKGDLKIFSANVIKEKLTAHVKSLGNSEELIFVDEDNRYYWKRGKRVRATTRTEEIHAPAEIFFELPKSFQEAHKKYSDKKDAADLAIAELSTKKDTLVLQIQIGSNVILDKLITQVDSIGDIDLFSSKLSLIAGSMEDQKQIGNGEVKPSRKKK